MPAISGKKGRVYGVTSTTPTGMPNEATTANFDNTEYTITAANKRYLDVNSPLTIESSPDGAVWSVVPADSIKEIHYAGGTVVFKEAKPVNVQVRLSGSYWPVAPLAECKGWSVDAQMDLEDSTVLGDNWKKYTPVLKSWSASLERFWVDTYFVSRIVQGKPVLVVLYVDEAERYRYEGFAQISKDGISTPVAGLVEEAVDVTGYGGLYPR